MQETIFDSKAYPGLNQSEIQTLLKKFGKNLFEQKSQGSFLRLVWDILREPMFLMLFGAAALYFMLGESGQGFLMLAAMCFVAAISIYQEMKSSRALTLLRQYTEPKVFVVRNGARQSILSEDLLPGDIFILEEGNKIPADGRIIQSNDFSVNESILTGESVPVEKNSEPGSDQIYQGTTINSGKCYATVTLTGNRTALGKLGKSISTITGPKTLLQKQIGRFVRIMALFGISAFALIWLINYVNSKDLAQSLLLGLTLAMSAVPEEIPVAFSSFMALGAAHMAGRGIISRQPLIIENLGAVSTICLDKTGTITENKMVVRTIYDYSTDRFEELNDQLQILSTDTLRLARLASEIEPFDAMEKAIVEAYNSHAYSEMDSAMRMIHEYPLSGSPPLMTHVYLKGNEHLVSAKGAPERVIRICKLDETNSQKIEKMVKDMASSGYRVLGICSAKNHNGPFPENQDHFDWTFAGLLALYDPPKKEAARVFQKWTQAGIQIKVITGDYPETVNNIASQVGINGHGIYATGEQVMHLSSQELQTLVRHMNIFARMFPDAKTKVVDALKANGEIVAMTGDGVNDGPALKSAHIGIAMGRKGTEIARESADLIITDDQLDKITEAIQEGRKIYSNLKKAIRYIISIHIPIILTASLPLLFGWNYKNIYTPIHIIFLELIMGPTCSIFYEREPVEPNIMEKKPRSRRQNMFSGRELLVSVIQGLVLATGILSIYYYFMDRNYSIDYVRTIVFTTLVFANVFLTFVNRSVQDTLLQTFRLKNSLVPWVLLMSAAFICSMLFIKPIQTLFHLTTIRLVDLLNCLMVALASTVWFEFYKGLRKALKKR
ncbi:MAG: cation-translocating P-type ATPase [Chitinophagales bacterium]